MNFQSEWKICRITLISISIYIYICIYIGYKRFAEQIFYTQEERIENGMEGLFRLSASFLYQKQNSIHYSTKPIH